MERAIRIKPLRQRLGLTQRALAEAVGVHPNTVARWERGELGISAAMVDRLEAVGSARGSGTAVARSSDVILDPHHGAIVVALNGKLDPDVFEACTAALLRHDYPTLVPVRGGADDGFDGAAADATGEPFPLITSTGEKLVANLRGNLDRTAKRGWSVARILFATPRRITPTTRRNLFEAARERGVTLVQTYDQDWFAQSLYREPEWCKRLLRVTGRPSALSLFPLTQRPVLGAAVLGREREIRWLLEHEGDCLLTGEPGSGKTFLLLRTLALQGYARFLVDGDRTQIANDLRSLRPLAVIVDDAHVNPKQITELIQIRSEVGAEFRIIATSWPGFSDPVKNALQIGSASVRELGRLDANTVVDIIRSSGVRGPGRLLYVIRKQAAGRPGLAATLAHLCLTGNVEDVVNGESLFQELHRGFDKMIGDEVLSHIAPFALGGDAGVKHDTVSRILGVSPLDLRRVLAKIGAAGVVSQRDNGTISIDPEPLRWSIVKRAFFDSPFTIDIVPFLSIVASRRDALQTLIGVRYRGAAIPELEEWLEKESSSDLWSAYVSLGAAEARYVLRRNPEIILEIAQSALGSAPEMAIPMILERASEEDAATRERKDDHLSPMGPDGPLEQLKTWARAISSDAEDVLERRLAIVRATIVWWKRKRNGRTAIRALCIALQPGVEYAILDPGIGNNVTQVSRMLRADELSALTEHWPAALGVIKSTEHLPWSDLFDLVQVWLVPQARIFPPVKVTDALDKRLRKFALTILDGVSQCSRQHPGVQHQIAEFSRRLSVPIDLNLCPEFEILCPSESFDSDDWESQHRPWSEATSRLALTWKDRPAGDVAAFLRWFEDEADLAGIQHPRLSPLFCQCLAELVPYPVAVAEELIRNELPSELVAPFLRRATVYSGRGWQSLALRCLGKERYRWIAVQTVLTHRALPRKTRTEAISAAAEMPNLRGFLLASCRSVPLTTITEMICSKNPRLAVATAVAFWQANRGGIPNSIRSAWRSAILRSATDTGIGRSDTHGILEILSKEAALALDWLVLQMTGPVATSAWIKSDLAKRIASGLEVKQRGTVLGRVIGAGHNHFTSEVSKALVGGDVRLYKKLLGSKSLEQHHLEPLAGAPDTGWRELALAALDGGYSEEDVAYATLGRGGSWVGQESERWIHRRQPFEALSDDPDDRIREVGRLCAEYTTYREGVALTREREQAIAGRH